MGKYICVPNHTETSLTYMDHLSKGLLGNPTLWPVQFIALVQLTTPLAGRGPVQAGMSQVSSWLIKDEGGILSALWEGDWSTWPGSRRAPHRLHLPSPPPLP